MSAAQACYAEGKDCSVLLCPPSPFTATVPTEPQSSPCIFCLHSYVQDHHDKGSAAKLFVSYYGLTAAVKVGSAILLDDGLVSLRVTEVREDSVTCMIENR